MLEVSRLTVAYDGVVAVDDVSLSVGPGEVLCVLGPSGSGKSSLLRAIAGLVALTSGAVRWGGTDISALAPHRRGFGFVFQDLALFPHRDVAGNVAFGLRMQRQPAAAIAARVEETLDLVGLSGFGARPVASLSGGELQRVALARALAPKPQLLLLDEPLSSLDRVLRDDLVQELRGLLRTLDVAAVHVTHDQQEALGLAGRVLVLRQGRSVQTGTPTEVWRSPADGFVARFLGLTNLVPGSGRHGVVTVAWGELRVDRAPEGPLQVVVPPDAVQIVAAAGSDTPLGTVAELVFRGDRFAATVRLDAGVTLDVGVDGDLQQGQRVAVMIDPRLVSVVPPEPATGAGTETGTAPQP